MPDLMRLVTLFGSCRCSSRVKGRRRDSRQGDQYRAVENNPMKLVAEEPVSTFRMDIDTASYPNIRRF